MKPGSMSETASLAARGRQRERETDREGHEARPLSLCSLVRECEWPRGSVSHILFSGIGWSADALEANSVMEEAEKGRGGCLIREEEKQGEGQKEEEGSNMRRDFGFIISRKL